MGKLAWGRIARGLTSETAVAWSALGSVALWVIYLLRSIQVPKELVLYAAVFVTIACLAIVASRTLVISAILRHPIELEGQITSVVPGRRTHVVRYTYMHQGITYERSSPSSTNPLIPEMTAGQKVTVLADSRRPGRSLLLDLFS